MLAGVQVEHELADRALQPRQRALQHDEARAGQFRRRLEIHHAERFADVEMLLRREGVIRRRADTCALDIAVLVGAVRHVVAAAGSGMSASAFCELVVEPRFRPPRRSAASSLSAATSAISVARRASSLAFLASPISFEAALRRACAS